MNLKIYMTMIFSFFVNVRVREVHIMSAGSGSETCFSSHHVKHVMTGGLEVFPISTFPQAKNGTTPNPIRAHSQRDPLRSPCWRTDGSASPPSCSWSSTACCHLAGRLLWSPGTWSPLFPCSVSPAVAWTKAQEEIAYVSKTTDAAPKLPIINQWKSMEM